MKKKKSEKEKITEKMTFAEAMHKNPESAEIFQNRGMHCVGCPMAMSETIEEGAKAHGINPKKLIEEVNKKVKKKK